MGSRAVRLTLTLLVVGAIAAAAYLIVSIERTTNASTTEARDLDAHITAANHQALELRAAQQAYVAAGQSAQFWFTKATTIALGLRESLSAVRSSVRAPASLVMVDEAQQTLLQFDRVDRRARDYAESAQNLLASDLIFSDGLETISQVLSALDAVRLAESNERTSAHAAARLRQLTYAAASAGFALFVILLLQPLPRRGEPVASSAVFATAVPDSIGDLDLGAQAARVAVTVPPPAFVSEAQTPDLETVASVCSELARVSDTASLPELLERTASALDATGIVLWVVDPDGKELTPIMSHGYPASLLSRMGAIGKDADNVTAAAFRTGLLQVVTADGTSQGAIAAPLINPAGCIGVMSAEMRHDGEQQRGRLAIATIVAAQLATLVAPPAARDNLTAAL